MEGRRLSEELLFFSLIVCRHFHNNIPELKTKKGPAFGDEFTGTFPLGLIFRGNGRCWEERALIFYASNFNSFELKACKLQLLRA